MCGFEDVPTLVDILEHWKQEARNGGNSSSKLVEQEEEEEGEEEVEEGEDGEEVRQHIWLNNYVAINSLISALFQCGNSHRSREEAAAMMCTNVWNLIIIRLQDY